MQFKIFIQAVKPGEPDPDKGGKPREIERMISYDIEAEDGGQAAAKARARFELEERMDGWEIAGLGSIEM